MVMVYVPGGEFEMGSDDDGVDYALQLCDEYRDDCEREWFENEQPVHTVTLNDFWIDQPSSNSSYTHASYYGNSAYDDYPVIYVSWHQANAYCEWAGARLPTEAEWEYAVRGPEERRFPWGNEFDGTRLNYCDANCGLKWADETIDDDYPETAPVEGFLRGASWCNALNMAGNVWEWVAGWYGNYSSGRQVGPTSPSSGEYRGLRGGSWYDGPYYVRGANRWGAPDGTDNDRGFRCARGSE
jgi:formylglycine-generating enzyme required for sulfatase activity